ncbi:DUF6364 family protein [Cecembia lonarensis]|uniref:Uncharacterized protein n=1 Tax=Cecembia lonarensis (strain CCUG 58316 / KCTC 22772 / LW9) TaxID=1225176 RepID=K1LBB8_CECL9|nr:DUF6364 family protein [Cecembia lonarensis]EKB49557.1 hypothetical protein B879_01853 [Cecembia lonarensis LW9]
MKTKLTLTIKKSVIETAKKRAKARGISLSRMIEEIFEDSSDNPIQTEEQRAAKRLLERLKSAPTIETKSDKDLLKEFIKRKYA